MKTENKRNARIRIIDKTMTYLFYCIGGLSILFLFLFAGYILFKGIRGFYPDLLKFNRNGIGNQLFNTIYIVVISLIISVPLGVLSGIYMAEYAKDNKLTLVIKVCIQALSSLPSIVIGLFGYAVFIVATGMSWNILAGGITISILSIPLITTTTEDALRALPPEYKEGSFGLGATHWQTIIKVLLPSCFSRIMTGVILAAGRGFGEAAALLYTSGQSTNINWHNWDITTSTCPLNLFRAGETLSLHIWTMRTEGSLNPNSEAIADFSAAVLIILVLIFSIASRKLGKKSSKKL